MSKTKPEQTIEWRMKRMMQILETATPEERQVLLVALTGLYAPAKVPA